MDFMGIFMMVTIVCGIVMPPIPPLITIIHCQDPYYTVARLVLPPECFSNLATRFIIALIRFLILTTTAIEISRVGVFFVHIMCTFSIITKSSINMIRQFYASLSDLSKLRGNLHVSIYKQFWLLIFMYNITSSFLFLLGVIIIECLFISLSVILIMLYEVLPLPTILVSLFFVFAIVILLGVLLPIVAGIYEQSKEMKMKWRSEVGGLTGDRRYVRRKLESLREFYLYVGYREHMLRGIERQSMTNYLAGLVGNTVDILLATR
jgi:hypothetical protein